jgi:hypothetical protein
VSWVVSEFHMPVCPLPVFTAVSISRKNASPERVKLLGIHYSHRALRAITGLISLMYISR